MSIVHNIGFNNFQHKQKGCKDQTEEVGHPTRIVKNRQGNKNEMKKEKKKGGIQLNNR